MKKRYFLLSWVCFIQLLGASEKDSGSSLKKEQAEGKVGISKLTATQNNKRCADYCCGATLYVLVSCVGACFSCCQEVKDCCKCKRSVSNFESL